MDSKNENSVKGIVSGKDIIRYVSTINMQRYIQPDRGKLFIRAGSAH